MFCFLQENAFEKALGVFVVPYLCQKAELYLDLWISNLNVSSGSTATPSPRNLLMGHDLEIIKEMQRKFWLYFNSQMILEYLLSRQKCGKNFKI